MFRVFLAVIIAALLLCGPASAQTDDLFHWNSAPSQWLTWDSEADTNFSISGTNADTSRAVPVHENMFYQLYFSSGTTSDSIKLHTKWIFSLYGSYNSPPTSAAYWTDTVCGQDSIGYYATADSTANTPIIYCGLPTAIFSHLAPDSGAVYEIYAQSGEFICLAKWARLVITGITGNRLSAPIVGYARYCYGAR